ncbi:putative integrase domain protein [Paraburkholderia fungorum]|jgi:hypothetical protein|uniref:Integrase domain protein n=1 Tax=Paraburkholderia fungorum TaxID=134537 RepID=A0AAU8STI9_9BURK|nr:putative integrase domain protein [Paraburkholderia fungorum]PRZ45507.1 hypothetical protein BX589_13822 [Paraburkholderia fungorum]
MVRCARIIWNLRDTIQRARATSGLRRSAVSSDGLHYAIPSWLGWPHAFLPYLRSGPIEDLCSRSAALKLMRCLLRLTGPNGSGAVIMHCC